jgi:rhodanese-related sulfurtransferase
LIDVRPKKDFKEVHATAAHSIPLSRLEPHSVLAHRKWDRRAPLYIMANGRALASLAACSLAGAGLDEPVVVEGGINAWVEQCLPMRGKRARRPFLPTWAVPRAFKVGHERERNVEDETSRDPGKGEVPQIHDLPSNQAPGE